MELKQHLVPQLKALRLSGILDTLDARTRQATDERWSYGEFLERLLEDEVERRAQKQLALRVRRADLPSDKTLETFDFTAVPGLNRQLVYELATGGYIREHRNVLVCGPTGVGKTHLAQGLAHEAARRGFDVAFTNAHKMLRHLHAGRADQTYDKRLAGYVRPGLLVIDDFGLKPLSPPNAEDLYDVIDERYAGDGAILLTSNRAPTEWAAWFNNPLLASAGLDRLAHNAHVLVITGPSYRARGRRQLEEVALPQ